MRDPLVVAVLIGRGAAVLEAAVPTRVFSATAAAAVGYRVLAVAAESRPLISTAGLILDPPHDLDAVAGAGTVIVPAWRDDGPPPPAEVLAVLRCAFEEGATVVGLCLGAFVLAETGLLDGLSATTHWSKTGELARRFPLVHVLPDTLYVDEGRLLTSAGSASSLDACLHLLRRRHGAAVASSVARELVVGVHRPGGDPQSPEQPVPPPLASSTSGGAGPGVADAVSHAVAHLDDPDLDIDALAATACMSRRSFDRHFRRTTGVSATRWLLRQRVHRAAVLLEQTDLPVDAVARRCGLASAAALRPHFRAQLGLTPSQWRLAYRDPAELGSRAQRETGEARTASTRWSGEAAQIAVSP